MNLYTVERCKSGISAATALSTTPGERKLWEKMIKFWQAQLKLAEQREAGHSPK